jgi:hypothetical protein
MDPVFFERTLVIPNRRGNGSVGKAVAVALLIPIFHSASVQFWEQHIAKKCAARNRLVCMSALDLDGVNRPGRLKVMKVVWSFLRLQGVPKWALRVQ